MFSIALLVFIFSTLFVLQGVVEIFTGGGSEGIINLTMWSAIFSILSFTVLYFTSDTDTDEEKSEELPSSQDLEALEEMCKEIKSDTYIMTMKGTTKKGFAIFFVISAVLISVGIVAHYYGDSELLYISLFTFPILWVMFYHESKLLAPFEGQIISINMGGLLAKNENIFIAWSDLQVRNDDKRKCIYLNSKKNPSIHFRISQYIDGFPALEEMILQNAEILSADGSFISIQQEFAVDRTLFYLSVVCNLGLLFVLYNAYIKGYEPFSLIVIIWLPIWYLFSKWMMSAPTSCEITQNSILVYRIFGMKIIDKSDIENFTLVRTQSEGAISQAFYVQLKNQKQEITFQLKDPVGFYGCLKKGKVVNNL